jgi:hypothetical protein
MRIRKKQAAKICHVSLCPRQDSNSATPEYKLIAVLPLQQSMEVYFGMEV